MHLLHLQLDVMVSMREREVGLQMGLKGSLCDDWGVGCTSKGMEAEIFAAGQMGIPVRRLPNIFREVPEQNCHGDGTLTTGQPVR